MRLLIVALLSLFPTAAAAAQLTFTPDHRDAQAKSKANAELAAMLAKCPPVAPRWADRKGEPLRPRKLTELPPANLYAAVYHHVGLCEVPIVVKYGVGKN
jgi:hypothetical protein